MEKQFPLVLNITKPIDPQNHIRFFRGDNVQFIFSYTDGEGNPPSIISEAVKLRVYAKKIYADGVKKEEMPIFSGEFDNKEVASFSSLQTAGDAGNYLMAVILLDALGNVITAQGVYLDLLENGYAGVYQPSPDFRDEVLDALAQAQAAAANAAASASSAQASLSAGENLYQQGLQQGNAILADCNSAKTAAQSSATSAEGSAQSAEVSAGIAAQQASDAESAKDAAVAAKNTATTQAGLAADSATNAAQSATTAQQAAAQAVEITDPEGWRTDTRAMIARLALAKSDSGTLYFTGGAATATPNLAFDTLSVLFKTDFDFFVDQTSTVFYPFILGTRNSGKYFTCQGGNVLRVMTVNVNTNDVVSIGYFTRTDISAVATGRLNSLAFVFKKLANGNAHVSLFVNGTAILNSISTAVPYSVVPNSVSVNTWAGTISSASKGTVGYSDFRILNFDVSATDAPYSLADYQAGKRLPPNLTGVQLALENYTIARNTTTKLIKDASGNGNDATVSGTVAGDMDAGIAAFVDELKTQISQQS